MACLMRDLPVGEPFSIIRMVIVPKGNTSPAFAGTKWIWTFGVSIEWITIRDAVGREIDVGSSWQREGLLFDDQ